MVLSNVLFTAAMPTAATSRAIKLIGKTQADASATRAEVSTLKNAKLCKIGVECVEFM